MLVAGLSTGHKIGLAVVGAIFIAFALSASFLAPRRWPDFPGKNGLSVFIIASFVLFAAMLTAVVVFGVESESEAAQPGTHGPPAQDDRRSPRASSRSRCPSLKGWRRARTRSS